MSANGEPRHSLVDAILANTSANTQLRVSLERLLFQYQSLETTLHELRLKLETALERLAVISKDVDDVERATREATGSFKLATKDDAAKPTVVGALHAFAAAPKFAQALIVIAFVALALSGWLARLLH